MVETIFGLISCLFIFTSNFQYWIKGKILKPCEKIVTAVSFSGIIFSVGNITKFIFLVFSLEMSLMTYLVYTFYFTTMYAFFSGYWLIACLCFFFFMKINNFNPGFFSWIKMKIDSLVPHLILTIEGLSICLSVIYTILSTRENAVNSTSSSVTNQTSYFLSAGPFQLFFLFWDFCIPVMIATVTIGHIIVSLYKHTHRMRRNMGDGDGPSLKVHKRAACTLSSLFVLYIISYSLTIAGLFSNDDTLSWIYELFSYSFPFLQSVIQILGNRRMLQNCEKILNRCRQSICPIEVHVHTVST
ncbi:hypothetical protein GDO86_017627 [Hymenochirus boettgeri]|uniref:Taste receptor type 2 n=1 Tax=Hymenochirus boettgeri TaxID=247094 RepID=A0A8T2IR41_9PIPI|nr:hypothetical protein GDO86_017627 [Hymenochirus boettgeri]